MSEPLRIENGMTIPQNIVGAGVEWNEEEVGRCWPERAPGDRQTMLPPAFRIPSRHYEIGDASL